MVIALGRELEEAILEAAHRRGVPPEDLAMEALRDRFLSTRGLMVPRDDWERGIMSIGKDCGTSPPPSAWTSDEMYD